MPDQDPTDGVAETTLGVTGAGPRTVKALAADPLSDRFNKAVYNNGDVDLHGKWWSVQKFPDHLLVSHAEYDGEGHRTMRLFDLACAIELRDMLDVLIQAVGERTGE